MSKQFAEYATVVQPVLDPTGQRTSKLCIEPFLYDHSLWQQMERITSAYAKLLEFVFQRFPEDKKIQKVLEYPPELESYLSALNIYPENLAAARVDLFLTKDGLKMVESNAEIPGGNEESYFLEQKFLEIVKPEGLTAVPRMEIVYDTLMHYYALQAKYFDLPKKDSLNIYLCQWQAEIDRIRGEYDILMSYVSAKGHRCDVIDPNEVTIRDGMAFDPKGERIDLIYRRFTADELPRFAKKSWDMAIEWDQAAVAVVNPFCTKRVDSKNIMVLFRDEEYDDVFPEELKGDLETVRGILPWTKKLKKRIVTADGRQVEARPYVLDNKDTLVIKHANAYSSEAVYIGCDLEAAKWQELVDEAIGGDWIVQELIDLPWMDMRYWEDDQVKSARCIYNINPYIYHGQIGGFLGRASTDKLTSFKSGEIASILPCLEKAPS